MSFQFTDLKDYETGLKKTAAMVALLRGTKKLYTESTQYLEGDQRYIKYECIPLLKILFILLDESFDKNVRLMNAGYYAVPDGIINSLLEAAKIIAG